MVYPVVILSQASSATRRYIWNLETLKYPGLCFQHFKAMAASGEVTVASHKRKAETAFGRKGYNRAVISDTLEKCSRLFGHPRRSHACVLQGVALLQLFYNYFT